MPGKSSQQRQLMNRLTASMTAVFEAAGAEFIEPDIIQPADVFLERSGEHIRSRTYVFTGPAGDELCLRPDLTVPACRYHLEHAQDPAATKRYCYAGKAFRHASANGQSGADGIGEFDQAGLELFGKGNAAQDDCEVLSLTLAALEAADVKDCRIELGDLGLFTALLASLDMPDRWRKRLASQFWRPRDFRNLLNELTDKTKRARSSLSDVLDEMADTDVSPAAFVEQTLEARELEMIAGRTIEQVAERLSEKLQDRSEAVLPADYAGLIDEYLSIRAAPEEASRALHAIAEKTQGPFNEAVDLFDARLNAMKDGGLDVGAMEFAAVFGRNLEYYTGLVFQVTRKDMSAEQKPLAGGGRYDTMLSDIGAGEAIPAVGCAIHASRILASNEGAA